MNHQSYSDSLRTRMSEMRPTPAPAAARPNLLMGFQDVALRDLETVRHKKEKIAQIDRIDRGQYTVADLDLLTYKQMLDLSPTLGRVPEVMKRMREVEARAAKELNQPLATFQKMSGMRDVCERVSAQMAGRPEQREQACRSIRSLISGSRNVENVRGFMREIETPVAQPSTPTMRRGYAS